MSRLDALLREADGDVANLLDRPTDEVRRIRVSLIGVFWGGDAFAGWRMTAIMEKASMTSETWRCQPCHERVSLWSRPSSVLAVSKASSIAQRCPSTATRASIGVPAGHQVLKKAPAPSARLRRISRPRVQTPVAPLIYSSASRS